MAHEESVEVFDNFMLWYVALFGGVVIHSSIRGDEALSRLPLQVSVLLGIRVGVVVFTGCTSDFSLLSRSILIVYLDHGPELFVTGSRIHRATFFRGVFRWFFFLTDAFCGRS